MQSNIVYKTKGDLERWKETKKNQHISYHLFLRVY